MKKVFISSLTAVVLVACSEPNFWEQTENIRVVAHSQTIEKMSLVWAASDSLCVFDDQGRVVGMSLEATGTGSGTFYTYEWTQGAPCFASYPYHEDAECDPSDSLVSVSLISEQSVSAVESCPAFVAVGMPEGRNNVYRMVPMKNVMGLVKMSVSKDNVSRVEVSANGGEALAGKVMVDYKKLSKGDAAFWTPMEGRTVSTVSLIPVPGSEASDEKGCFRKGFHYVSVLPGTCSQGIDIRMFDESGTQVDGIHIPGNVIIPVNAVFDVDDLMPDDVVLTLDFASGSNPLGSFPLLADQLTSGDDYPYTYDYQFNGGDMTKEFTFTMYKGAKGYQYTRNGDVSVLLVIKPDSTAGKDQCCIKFPAVPYRYLKSVTVTHRGTSYARNFRLQEGYPTPGHYFTLSLADGAAADMDDRKNVATGVINIPTGATSTAQIQSTKRDTPYCLQFTSNADYNIERIELKYSRTLE